MSREPWCSREAGSGPLVDPAHFPASGRSTYLNAASAALMYRGARRSTVEWQRELAENGATTFDETAEEMVFEDLHRAGARLFNASPDDIAVATSVTELLCSLAWAVAPGPRTNVVSTRVVHPSTHYPWVRVSSCTDCEVRLAPATDGYADPDALLASIDDRTAVVSVSHAEFRTGQLYDLASLAEVAHAHGALLVVDATQSAGAVPIDVSTSGVDALVCAGYKWLCGPFGAALMYLAPHLQGMLDPGLIGWRSHEDMWDLRADRLELPNGARRFEFSTMGYGCAVGLTRSIEFLVGVGVERISAHNLRLADLLVGMLRERGAEIVSPLNERERTSTVAARFPGRDSARIAARLNASGVVVSSRGDAIRVSPHLYNAPDDIERARDELDRCLRRNDA